MKRVLLPLLLLSSSAFAQIEPRKGILLETLYFQDAEKVLTPDAVVVISIGAAAKQHGYHLPLNTDFLQAEFFKTNIALKRNVVIAPTINYSYYPIFLKFGGSTSLRYTTARDMILEIVREFAAHGPKRFYLINQGITTNLPLADAKKILADEGILMLYSDLTRPGFSEVENSIRTVPKGSHADEVETSNLLYIAPQAVDMSKAVDDTSAVLGGLSISRKPTANGMLSPSGVYGFGTLGTREKGKHNMEGQLQMMLKEIDSLQKKDLPAIKDQSTILKQYAGTYEADGKKLIINPSASYLDYTWDGKDHSDFYRLYFYNKDMYASQMLDVIFIRQDEKVKQALCIYRGNQYFLKKVE